MEKTVCRYHCADCRRFLCKLVLGLPLSLVMIPCSNCKKLNLLISDGKALKYRVLEDKNIEPDGVVKMESIELLMKDALELTIDS